MGGLSCNCLKSENNTLVISEMNSTKTDVSFLRSVKRIQNSWRSFSLHKSEIKKSKANFHKSRSLDNQFPFHLRTELKEIYPETFTPFVSDKVLAVIKTIGPFIIEEKEQKYLDSINLYKMNPILYQNNVIYIGTYNEKGQREGLGIMYLPEGGKFEGFFKSDLMNGRGRLVNFDGDYYEGYFDHDKANGFGKYVSSEGVVFKGNWKDDKQDGKGEEVYLDGSRYEGEYSKGSKEGKGKFIWADGSIYEGNFKDNCLHGFGCYKWKDGRLFNGNWVINKMEGSGEFLWPDGKKYIGQYKQDKKWGYGVFFWPNGKKYEGGWFSGKQHGLGILTINEEKKYGEWKMGRRLRWISENEGNYSKIIDEIKTTIAKNDENVVVVLNGNLGENAKDFKTKNYSSKGELKVF